MQDAYNKSKDIHELLFVVQLLSRVRLFATGWTQLSDWIERNWVNNAIQPVHPLSPPSPFAIYLSQHQGLFQWVNPSIRWPKYWSLSFSFSPFSEYLGFISFRMDWFDLLAVQGTLKSLLQHHNLKTSVLWHLAFFVVQFSHLYMTTGKISYTLILKNRME